MVIDYKRLTVDTYNQSAKELAQYFRGIGSRVEDIEKGLELSGKKNPFVVEVGCGDGRDAVEILRRTNNYLGIDISEGMLSVAREINPKGKFEVADLETYQFPGGMDVVFCFASLLHSPKEQLKLFFEKMSQSLAKNGLLYISLKEGRYQTFLKKDKYGTRLFYFYTPQMIKKLAKPWFEAIHLGRQVKGDTRWFTLVLKK